MVLKTYTNENINLHKLHDSIVAAGHVNNFQGLESDASEVHVLGSSIIDEASLDQLIANHDPVEIPEMITPRQAKQALFLSGITAALVEAAIGQLPSPYKELALIEWEYSTAFIRANPLVNQIGAVFGKTPSEIDQIWILGSTL